MSLVSRGNVCRVWLGSKNWLKEGLLGSLVKVLTVEITSNGHSLVIGKASCSPQAKNFGNS